jgi:regulator of sigma E protease
MTFEVVRPEGGNDRKTVTITATPDASLPWIDFYENAPEDVPGLGLAYAVNTKIGVVRPGTPAAKAGLAPGNEIEKLTVTPPKDTKIKNAKPETIEFSDKALNWPLAFAILQADSEDQFEVKIKGMSKPIGLAPEPRDDWFNPSRGLRFRELVRRLPPQEVAAAVRRGTDDTIDNIRQIYAMLRSLAQRRVSPKTLGGPIKIVQVGYAQASTGLTEFVHFLGILSINLAVLNFLPIPPLDGGQMVFLIGEKVRGRPLPESAVIWVSYVGIGLLLALMGYVIFQDVWYTVF